METFTAMETLLKVRVATTDLDAWKLAAAREGIGLSEWVRETLDRAIKQDLAPHKPQKPDYKRMMATGVV